MIFTVSPNPTLVNSTVKVSGSGLAKKTWHRILLDGAIKDTLRTTPQGAFNVGISVGSVAKTSTVILQQRKKTDWSDAVQVAQVSLVIQVAVPPPPPPPPPTGTPTVVTSVSEMMNALRDTSVRDIMLRNGTYPISWLDVNGDTAGYIRTPETAVVVRAETPGGVILDAQGSSSVHMLFRNGVAYQEWQGFKLGNSHPWDNGVIQFGEGRGIPVHHVTLKDIEFLSSITQGAGPSGAYRNGQGIYFSWAQTALGGNHDILIDGFVCNAKLWSAIHVYHDNEGHCGHHVTIRRMTVGTENTMGVAFWSRTANNYVFEDCTINGVNEYGIFVNYTHSASAITMRRVVTTGSGKGGFYATGGTYPNVPGFTFENCSFQ